VPGRPGLHSAPPGPVAGGERAGWPLPKNPTPRFRPFGPQTVRPFQYNPHSENPGFAPDREKACLQTLRGNYFDAELGLGLPCHCTIHCTYTDTCHGVIFGSLRVSCEVYDRDRPACCAVYIEYKVLGFSVQHTLPQ